MGSGHHEFGGDEIEQEPKVWGRTKGIDMEVKAPCGPPLIDNPILSPNRRSLPPIIVLDSARIPPGFSVAHANCMQTWRTSCDWHPYEMHHATHRRFTFRVALEKFQASVFVSDEREDS